MANTMSDTPLPGNTLSTDQGNMRQNFNYLVSTLKKDHQLAIGDTDAASFEGRHTQVSLNNRGSVIPIPGDGTSSVLFDNVGNLVWRNTAGVVGILGVNNTNYPKTNQNGTSWLPGTGSPFTGIGIQWGTIAVNISGAALTTVKFNTPFSGPAYNVQITGIQSTNTNTPSANSVFVVPSSVTNAQFQVSNSSSGTLNQIYWTAIGPV